MADRELEVSCRQRRAGVNAMVIDAGIAIEAIQTSTKALMMTIEPARD